jgi:hypothetical protein
MEFYTENPATYFQNGILSDLEVLAIKRFKNGLGIGFVESWIQQVINDESTAADSLNGFVGCAFGIGPIAAYSTKLGKSHFDLARVGFMTSTSASASRVMASTSARA